MTLHQWPHFPHTLIGRLGDIQMMGVRSKNLSLKWIASAFATVKPPFDIKYLRQFVMTTTPAITAICDISRKQRRFCNQ